MTILVEVTVCPRLLRGRRDARGDDTDQRPGAWSKGFHQPSRKSDRLRDGVSGAEGRPSRADQRRSASHAGMSDILKIVRPPLDRFMKESTKTFRDAQCLCIRTCCRVSSRLWKGPAPTNAVWGRWPVPNWRCPLRSGAPFFSAGETRSVLRSAEQTPAKTLLRDESPRKPATTTITTTTPMM